MRRLVSSAASLGALVMAHAAPAQTAGSALFSQNCAACHQPNGQGVHGAFPALAGDPFVQGDSRAVASVLLNWDTFASTPKTKGKQPKSPGSIY